MESLKIHMMSEKYIILSKIEFNNMSTFPSKYYFINALGEYILVKTRTKAKAQELCDEYVGEKGKYKIRVLGV